MGRTTGTVIVPLEPSIGELRTDGDRATGIDLLPGVESVLGRLVEERHTVVVLLPEAIGLAGEAPSGTPLPGIVVAAGTLESESLKAWLPDHGTRGRRKPVFVSADRRARESAVRQLGGEAVPHLAAAEWLLDGKGVVFARILTRQRPDIRTRGLLPYSVERVPEGWLTFGLATEACLLRLAGAGATFDLLPLPYQTADCAFLRIDSAQAVTRLRWPGASLLAWMPGRLVLALEGPDAPQLEPASRAHGALELLWPSPELLTPTEDPAAFTRRAVSVAAALGERSPDLVEAVPPAAPSAALALALPDAATFLSDCRRYSGQEPLGGAAAVVSRHIRHPDNLRVVNALVADMSALGYCAYTHGFVHNGLSLSNVIADLPGTGYFRIKPEILKKLVFILKKYPHPWPWPEVERALARELGRPTVTKLLAAAGGPHRRRLEEIAGIHRWLPSWRVPGHLIGIGAQLVVVGCHLDSSADRTAGYNPAADAAPGMDDNASGIAACLALARHLAAFRGQLVHTVRFCFFNAEEAGLVGSKAYAAYLKLAGAPVKSVLCVDMVGYNSDANRLFEIHAGYTDPAVRDRSLAVATMVQTWAASLGVLLPAQIYKGTSASIGAPDRDLCDPAINRSDHAAFHQQGYGAAVVTEDYFANLATEPGKDPNPNYHTAGDTTIDAAYGAAIASAAACAVKEVAAG